MKRGRSGIHPEPLEEAFPRNVGTNRNIRCHRKTTFYVYTLNCKQYSGYNVEIGLFTRHFLPLFPLFSL
jgi:hypothetical protein